MNKRQTRKNKPLQRTVSKETRTGKSDGVENYQYRGNDPRYYGRDPQLVKDVASFPYGWPLGTRLNFGERGSVYANKMALPGIMTIHWAPSVGWSEDANSPVNVAARNIYSYVRHANSGHSNYDAPDLMLYMLGMDSAYSMIQMAKRVYGVINTASFTNRYFPKAMVEALGFDYDDLVTHLSDFRAYINQCVLKVGSMCVPATMSYFRKHMWMNEHIFADHNSSKSQVYAFVMDLAFRFRLGADGAGELYATTLSHSEILTVNRKLIKFSDYQYRMNNIMNSILEQEDFNIMSGDILKAYGPENVIKLASIDEGYTVLPHYDEVALDQIQNSTLVGIPIRQFIDDKWLTVPGVGSAIQQSEDKSFLIHKPEAASLISFQLKSWSGKEPGLNIFGANKLISFTHDGISADETMEATRMANVVSDYHDVSIDASHNARFGRIYTAGSEIAMYGRVHVFTDLNFSWDGEYKANWHMTSIPFTASVVFLNTYTTTDGTTLIADLISDVEQRALDNFVTIQNIDQFNRHPVVALTSCSVISNTVTGEDSVRVVPFSGVMYDTDNYTILSADDLKEMAETALLSEFTVTQYGREISK